MARNSRQYCENGCYHIILRGVNRREIFHDDQDRQKYLDTLQRFSTEQQIDILAYCLMDNHVHLLVRAGESLSLFVKKIASSYVYYFNHKYDRVGHLFQERFHSVAILNDEQLLATARYILQNPRKAGICQADEYPWSSWQDLEWGCGLCRYQLLCDIIGDLPSLKAFVLAYADDMPEDRGAPDDEAAQRILKRVCGISEPSDIATLPKNERNAALVNAKQAGLTIRQLSRLTGLDRNIIQRAK